MTGKASAGLAPAHPTFAEAATVWAKIGLLSFGGPAGQIALMHRELVEERRWISESGEAIRTRRRSTPPHCS